MATLYLHIGMPKTGTTYIQNFLRANNEVLKKEGYTYPDFGVSFGTIGLNRNAHFLVSVIRDEDRNRHIEEEQRIESECFDKLFSLFDEYPNVILSDESIWSSGERKRDKNFWPNFKNKLTEHGVELKAIVYLRRQDLFIQSFWAQHVKENSISDTLPEYINTPRFKRIRLDYYARLNEISEVIGKENMLVRVYEKDQYIGPKKTIISDFLTTIGLNYVPDNYTELDRLPNRTLSGIYLETKRELNKIEGFNKRKSYIQSLLRSVINTNDEVHSISSNEFMTSAQAASFLKRYEESNEKVAREYLGREDGKLFYDKQKLSDDNLPEYTVSDYVGVLAKMIETQNNKVCELRGIVYQQKETIKELRRGNKEFEVQNRKLQSTIDWMSASFPKKVARKLKRVFGIEKKSQAQR
ncbi:MAG: hypothetical protein J1E96_07355 [Ruminococcus sp.]|nr:hypothetical protein [Ruminococcus sp.]